MAAARLKAEPFELKPLGRGRSVPLNKHKKVQNKAFIRPDVNVKVEPKPLPQDEPGTYTDYELFSSGSGALRVDLMKFKSDIPVELLQWARPVKLNRKEANKRVEDKPLPATPLLGPDGKPVIGVDGKTVMTGGPDAKGTDKDGKGKGKEKEKDPKKKFGKKTKTRQVFQIPNEVRQLRKEERHPWVLESGDKKQQWIGRLDDRSPLHVLFGFSKEHQGGFRVIPVAKWYIYNKRPPYRVMTLDEAEATKTKTDLARWFNRRNGGKASASILGLVEGKTPAVVEGRPAPSHNGSRAVQAGGRRLFVRVGGANDREEGKDVRRGRAGGDGEYDELEYEEEFQDDDEHVQEGSDDEDVKQLVELENREMRKANVINSENRMYNSSDEELDEVTEEIDKAMIKTLRKREKGVYAEDSDDEEKNPYFTEEDEDDSEEENPKDVTPIPTGVKPMQTPPAGATPPRTLPKPQTTGSTSKLPARANSPPMPHNAASLLAKRATGPRPDAARRPPLPGQNDGPGLSQFALEAGGSRAHSPPPRAHSPTRAQSPTRAHSPPAIGQGHRKRKNEHGSQSSDGPDRGGSPSQGTTPRKKPKVKHELEDFPGKLPANVVIEYLRARPRTTHECVHEFKTWCSRDSRNKQALIEIIRRVSKTDNGVLVLQDDKVRAELGS